MSESSNTVSIFLYPEQKAIVDSYAKDEGFSRSLAVRRIINEWVEFKTTQLRLIDTPVPYEV